jgi:hypothetical protein
MLVLELIFEADLPPEQYAYRPGRNVQQAVVEVEAQLFRGHPEAVYAELADYFESITHAELIKSVRLRRATLYPAELRVPALLTQCLRGNFAAVKRSAPIS